MNKTESDADFSEHVIDACLEQARRVLAAQLPLVEERNFDFEPGFKKTTIELFLVGVMWRFSEQFDLPITPRDRWFVCLLNKFVKEGMSFRAAKHRIAYLNRLSRTADGKNNLPISIGYEVGSSCSIGGSSATLIH